MLGWWIGGYGVLFWPLGELTTAEHSGYFFYPLLVGKCAYVGGVFGVASSWLLVGGAVLGAAICGRWVMESTCRCCPARAITFPSFSATSPLTPESISSITVGSACSESMHFR